MHKRSAYLSVRYALKLLEKGKGHKAPNGIRKKRSYEKAW